MTEVCYAVHAYDALRGRFARIAALEEVGAILHWDTSVTMPSGSAGARAEQMATLAGLSHQLLTAPELAGHLEDAEDQASMLAPLDRRNLALMRRKHLRATALPAGLNPQTVALGQQWSAESGGSELKVGASPCERLISVARITSTIPLTRAAKAITVCTPRARFPEYPERMTTSSRSIAVQVSTIVSRFAE